MVKVFTEGDQVEVELHPGEKEEVRDGLEEVYTLRATPNKTLGSLDEDEQHNKTQIH
jgi:hypothetical protein